MPIECLYAFLAAIFIVVAPVLIARWLFSDEDPDAWKYDGL